MDGEMYGVDRIREELLEIEKRDPAEKRLRLIALLAHAGQLLATAKGQSAAFLAGSVAQTLMEAITEDAQKMVDEIHELISDEND
jgi:hypothetical protein